MAEITYLEAISQGLRDEMEEDDTVFLIGEDIGAFGGAFKVTDGFIDQFPGRVIDAPLAENAIIGASVGAALTGLKPVAEMQFADFISCGFDQLVNVAAKMHFRQKLAVPMVIRLPSGGGFSGGPYHSQNPEAWFLQSPGLKVVAPSSVSDAYALIRASIKDPNPVCFLEHKGLYRTIKGQLDKREIPLSQARIVKKGEQATIITYGSGVGLAEQLVQDVEIIDLRTLQPWDEETVFRSVQKTSKALVLHEATQSCGVGAELVTKIQENCFEYLDAPISRLCTPDCSIPFSPPLEALTLPSKDSLERKLDELIDY